MPESEKKGTQGLSVRTVANTAVRELHLVWRVNVIMCQCTI